ncbi:MAG TPA: beta-ketoacyl-ACP synthase III [Mycobacteriales bacterium]|nr:beta-ketoacyl-ACP synthase III [Mycobacteriales bacterium]
MIADPPTMRHSRILGVGEHRPAHVMSNAELPAELETDDMWIRQRTGIERRHLAADDETLVSMASSAATKALADSGVDPARVGQVILATCSMPDPIPGGAPRIADAIGAPGAGAYDLNGACAGFCYALSAASNAVRTGAADYVVVAGAERLSRWLDWTDRSSAILFGDGAGAVVVGPSDRPGIGPLVSGSDGTHFELIAMSETHHVRLDGPAVFRWATTTLGEVARQVCAAAGVEPTDLAAVVLHQANLRIINAIAKELGATNAVVAADVVDTGNTSAASVPLALARLRREGQVASGDLAMTLAFGAGLTWAGAVIEVP